jgi:hypothetical protein
VKLREAISSRSIAFGSAWKARISFTNVLAMEGLAVLPSDKFGSSERLGGHLNSLLSIRRFVHVIGVTDGASRVEHD